LHIVDAVKKFIVLNMLLLASCSISGPVDTSLNDSADIPVVNTPQLFHSDIDELEEIQNELYDRADWSSFGYQALIQREDEIVSSLEQTQSELIKNGELSLESGRSYSFNIQSFCVNPGQYRPLAGDGFRVGLMTGDAQKWLPDILEKLPKFSVQQDQAQNLIWQLLTGVTYDNLGRENQRVLDLFFSDAYARFGNSAVNSIAGSVIRSITPPEVGSTIDDFNDLKAQALAMQDDFRGLEKLFSPSSNRLKALPVGWMRMKEGYLIKVTSRGYQETRIDLYVPADGRTPQSKNTIKMSNLVALPSIGQRLALSHKVIIPSRTRDNQYCKKLSEFKPKNCHALSDDGRASLLKFADPMNFSKSRYQSPPDSSKPIEEETDCSRFIQQVYERAGMKYLYSSTATFQCLSVFSEVDKAEEKAGDLVLYRGHVGILTKNGKVISATKGGSAERSKLKPTDPAFLPAITELPTDQFGPGKVLRWRCP
jgi:hypothetical protein